MEYRDLLQQSWDRRRGLAVRRAETQAEPGLLTVPVADRRRPRLLRKRLRQAGTYV
jgi:hypothetical protein